MYVHVAVGATEEANNTPHHTPNPPVLKINQRKIESVFTSV